MVRVGGDKVFHRHQHSGDGAFHIRRAAAVEQVAVFGGHERIKPPFAGVSGGHHVGVPGEHQQRAIAAAPRPEVTHFLEPQRLALEAQGLQLFDHPVLTAFVLRRHRRTANQFLGVLEGSAHGHSGFSCVYAALR